MGNKNIDKESLDIFFRNLQLGTKIPSPTNVIPNVLSGQLEIAKVVEFYSDIRELIPYDQDRCNCGLAKCQFYNIDSDRCDLFDTELKDEKRVKRCLYYFVS